MPETTPIELEQASVYIANVSPGNVSIHFTKSLIDLIRADELEKWGCWAGNLWVESGANISKPRNELVSRFLDQTDGEWLLFLDSDMVYPPDTMVRLLAAARHADTKVIGGLCVMVGELGAIPTIYQYDRIQGSNGITRVQFDYQDNALVQVAATGGACLMVHRSVLEHLREVTGNDFAWFQECTMTREGETHWISEDIAFCLRANELGYSIFVDTTLHIGHAKHGRIWYPQDIRDGTGQPRRKTVAIIPTAYARDTSGRWGDDDVPYVHALTRQLLDQGDVDEIIVIENGVEKLPFGPPGAHDGKVTILDGKDQGIHEMWNQGVAYAIEQHTARVRIAILNDDLRLGPEFLKRLSRALDDNPDVTAVCGNYDGRTGTGIERTADICANRYDGTGGFAGFAFMVRGEWFSSGYKFPEELKWWCGDNDLITAIGYSSQEDAPKSAAIVLDATVEHLDGGGGTSGDGAWSDPKWQEITRRDIEKFHERWRRIAEQDEARRRLAEGDLTSIYEALRQRPSDINEHLETLHDLVIKLDAKRVIELGTRGGTSTVAWLAGLHQTDGHLWAVDINPGPPELAGHPRLTFTQGHDLDPFVMQQLPDEVDIVFVDTDHTYELTQAEIDAYARRIRSGGAMVFHDTAVEVHEHHTTEQPPYPVRQAIAEWTEAEDLDFTEYPNNYGLIVVTVP